MLKLVLLPTPFERMLWHVKRQVMMKQSDERRELLQMTGLMIHPKEEKDLEPVYTLVQTPTFDFQVPTASGHLQPC